MTNNMMFYLETALFDGAAVAWGIWEYMKVRPKKSPKPSEPVSTLPKSAPDSAPE